ncbi:FtsX-like permease family protein [Kitasatospora mediocidica]|uniref:FtsX-like permease family protein n=1 Tax=Kitasatospora mediocidica TaxID=58352 RepID=UPI00056BF5F3|nr:FtsX-like permease family protein [Kitasatospora mediocidica]
MGGFVLRRLRSRLALAGAALLTVLLTAGVLSALSAFDSGVGDAGLRRALSTGDRGRAAVLASATVPLGGRADADHKAHQLATELFGSHAAPVTELAVSNPYALPPTTGPATDFPDLTILASLDPAHVRLTSGRLPAHAAGNGAPTQVAVPDIALARLGLKPQTLPATLHLTDRYSGADLAVTVTGSYRPLDDGDPYWQLDPLGGHGLQVSGFTDYGPLLADDSAFTGGAATQHDLHWLITADFSRIGTADLDALRARVATGTADAQADFGLQATSALPQALDDLRSGLLVARSTLLIGALQLVVLAGAALLLVTRLLSERQQAENALLTARGAARRRMVALSAAEAALLALPAVLFGPLLTPPLFGLLCSYGPLAGAGVRLGNGLALRDWIVSLAVGCCCVVAVLAPTALRAAASVALRRAGRRQALVSGLARSGADLALIALAVLAYLQLAHYSGGGLSADAGGRLGIDPVLVSAPTLVLCAGTLLVLRVLPPLARIGERLAGRGRGLAAALAGWQFARRPARQSGPALLLVLAVSMGMLAIGQGATWNRSQRDQADSATAGGLRVTSTELPSLGQGGVLGALPGGDRVLPVSRQQLPLKNGKIGTLLALDSAQAARYVRVRPDLTQGRTPAQLFGPLATPTPAATAGGIVLPGRPVRIDLDVSVRITESDSPFDRGSSQDDTPAPGPSLRLELRDRFGVPYDVAVPALPHNGDATVSVDLGPLLGLPLGAAAYPLTLTGAETSYQEQDRSAFSLDLTLRRIATADTPTGPAGTATPTADLRWSVHCVGPSSSRVDEADTAAHLDQISAQAPVSLHYSAGVGDQSGTAVIGAAGPDGGPLPVPSTLDAVATEDYLRATGTAVGQIVPVQFGLSTLRFHLVAAVRGLPTLNGEEPGGTGAGLLADLASIDRILTAARQPAFTATEWWLPGDSPTDPRPARAAAALRSGSTSTVFQVDAEQVAALRTDPLGAAPQGALLALSVIAATLAAIGFAAGAAGTAGERAAEFAVLRALGTPQRRLARITAAEQTLVILLGLGVGAGLGVLLVRLVVPLVVLTPTAHRPVPAVLVQLPPGQVALLLLAVAALPVLLTLRAVLKPTRAADTAARLRYSEDT